MAEPQPYPVPQERRTAPDSGIFLSDELFVPESLLELIGRAPELQATSQQASQELHELFNGDGQAALRGALKRFGQETFTQADHILMVKQNVLEDLKGGYADLISRVTSVSDSLAFSLTRLLDPGDYAIGQNTYRVALDDRQRLWLTLVPAEDDGYETFFDRYDADTDSKVRIASPTDCMQLILDISSERQKLSPAEEPVQPRYKQANLLSPAPKTAEDSYFRSEKIASFSANFFKIIEPLIPSGQGVISQVEVSRTRIIKPGQNKKANPGSLVLVSIGLDARAHIARRELYIDDKGESFEGPGDFRWQVATTRPNGRIIQGFRATGSIIKPDPTVRLDRAGHFLDAHDPDYKEIKSMWGTIFKIIGSEVTTSYIAAAQQKFKVRQQVPLVERQREVLERLNRTDLLGLAGRAKNVVKPAGNVGKDATPGFRGTLVDVEKIIRQEAEREKFKKWQPFTGPELVDDQDAASPAGYRVVNGRVVEVWE